MRTPRTAAIREWMVKRGILYALTQTPMIALIIGYFWRWVDFPTATAFTVILAFILLPVWILVRLDRSDDPEEPARHFHKYALYALVPYVVYNLARIPMHFLLNIVFWDHWYDFGAELTGQPVDQWASLIPGTFIHSLQGYVLALGFYVLYRRHSLLNALIYVWIFLSTIYTWTYPTFILVDYQPPPKWFFVVWWAHFWMALAAWYVPKGLYTTGLWRRFRTTWARVTAIVVLVLIYFLPVGFVFVRVPTWQFPMQYVIDQANFNRVQLVLHDGPVLTAVDLIPGNQAIREARYEFTLRFGPRSYRDYINAVKALDAGPIQITGRLIRQGEVIAWCSGYVDMLETPNNILIPAEYFPALERMEYTDVPVACMGPASAAEELGREAGEAAVEIHWTAAITLIGDRERMDRTIEEALPVAALHITETASNMLAAGSGR